MTQQEFDCLLRIANAFERIAKSLERLTPDPPMPLTPRKLTDDDVRTVTPQMRAAWAREDLDRLPQP